MDKAALRLLACMCLVQRVVAEDDDKKDENVALAIVLSLAAGLATTIGGATPFFPSFRKIAEDKVLAGSLALASGVMVYVSFVEIYVKSNDSITLHLRNNKQVVQDGSVAEVEDVGFIYPGDKYGNLYTTLSFFTGCVIVMLLHKLVHLLSPVTEELEDHDVIKHHEEEEAGAGEPSQPTTPNEPVSEPVAEAAAQAEQQVSSSGSVTGPDSGEGVVCTVEGKIHDDEKKDLKQMGIMTAVALGLHNFPEGFATFIATLEEPSLGVALAVAIAIHNIPEGICVAMPVYYATGSKWKGLGWAFLSGLSEPVGGILGWLVLRSVFNDLVFGLVFGAVGGMMVWIVLSELLPTAYNHDKSGKIVGPTMFVGMVIISASLIAFAFA